jgi:plastocyanin
MNSKYTWILGLAVLVVVAVAGYLLFGANSKSAKTQNQNTKTTKTANNAGQAQQLSQETVTLTASGFNPQTLTVKTGTIIIWLNKSGAIGTVNSDNHPTNLLFPFLNLGRFDNGSSVSLLFSKAGKYAYHNELNPDQRGTITVE